MAKYIVAVERTILQSALIEVEARNADLASEIVEKDARAFLNDDVDKRNVFNDTDWELESDVIENVEDPYTEDEE